MNGFITTELVQIKNVPEAFLPGLKVDLLSPTAIRLGEWPLDVYAGRQLAELGERLESADYLPRVRLSSIPRQRWAGKLR